MTSSSTTRYASAPNRALHTWGVADGGFQVTGSGTSVSIGAGMALDGLGQEIILLSAQTLDLSKFGKNADVFVTIQYQEVASDSVDVDTAPRHR